MDKIMKYSILRYTPSKISGESINLGIIFDSKIDNYLEFRYTKKFSRLMHFDDEIDMDDVKRIIKSIEEDINDSLFSKNLFDIENYVKYFINNFNFDRPKSIVYDDLEEVITSLHKAYFRFEYDKKSRPSVNEDKKLLFRMLSNSGKHAMKDRTVLGAFNDRITYDLITDDYNIKIFDFDNKDLNRLISSAKAWAWNAKNSSDKDLLILYRYNDETRTNNQEFNIIMDILNDSGAQVMDIEKGMALVQS